MYFNNSYVTIHYVLLLVTLILYLICQSSTPALLSIVMEKNLTIFDSQSLLLPQQCYRHITLYNITEGYSRDINLYSNVHDECAIRHMSMSTLTDINKILANYPIILQRYSEMTFLLPGKLKNKFLLMTIVPALFNDVDISVKLISHTSRLNHIFCSSKLKCLSNGTATITTIHSDDDIVVMMTEPATTMSHQLQHERLKSDATSIVAKGSMSIYMIIISVLLNICITIVAYSIAQFCFSVKSSSSISCYHHRRCCLYPTELFSICKDKRQQRNNSLTIMEKYIYCNNNSNNGKPYNSVRASSSPYLTRNDLSCTPDSNMTKSQHSPPPPIYKWESDLSLHDSY